MAGWSCRIARVAAILLIGNTVRVAAYSRRRETGVMRLVGATRLSIQLPFLVEGIVAGLVGAAIAVGAWVVSIPVISGIAIVIGGFLALMSVLTFVQEGRKRIDGARSGPGN